MSTIEETVKAQDKEIKKLRTEVKDLKAANEELTTRVAAVEASAGKVKQLATRMSAFDSKLEIMDSASKKITAKTAKAGEKKPANNYQYWNGLWKNESVLTKTVMIQSGFISADEFKAARSKAQKECSVNATNEQLGNKVGSHLWKNLADTKKANFKKMRDTLDQDGKSFADCSSEELIALLSKFSVNIKRKGVFEDDSDEDTKPNEKEEKKKPVKDNKAKDKKKDDVPEPKTKGKNTFASSKSESTSGSASQSSDDEF